ncbi:hypothetical protein IWQ56_005048, partial [Coemansia nantahalensis]
RRARGCAAHGPGPGHGAGPGAGPGPGTRPGADARPGTRPDGLCPAAHQPLHPARAKDPQHPAEPAAAPRGPVRAQARVPPKLERAAGRGQAARGDAVLGGSRLRGARDGRRADGHGRGYRHHAPHRAARD